MNNYQYEVGDIVKLKTASLWKPGVGNSSGRSGFPVEMHGL